MIRLIALLILISLPARGASQESIADYVVDAYEDRHGTLWFGTMQKGVARYDGKTFGYLTVADGLPSNTVSCIVEDQNGTLWFGTHAGLVRYDGKTFHTYGVQDGLPNERVTRIQPGRDGTLWIATFDGVCRLKDGKLKPFPLPTPELAGPPGQHTLGPFQLPGMNWVRDILIDRKGHVWFSRDGYGATRYDGKNFRHFTRSDGLASNLVFSLAEDRDGQIWFACVQYQPWFGSDEDHKNPDDDGGVSVYDGTSVRTLPEINHKKGNNVFTVYRDRRGQMWVSNIGRGVFRYHNKQFTHLDCIVGQKDKRLDAVQCVLEDSKGNLWFGCSGGLYRMTDQGFVTITPKGPWPKDK